MLKLIASDMDGTLLPYGEDRLPDRLFSLVRELRARGVLFCPASGRPYRALRQFFAPVADEVCFLCENGAVVYGPGPAETAPLLSTLPMPRTDAVALARDVSALPFCEVLISGLDSLYVLKMEGGVGNKLRSWLKNPPAEVDDPAEVPGEIIKVSAFCPDGVTGAARALGPRWGHYNMAEAGPTWLDFTLANKGRGLLALCAALGIDPAQTAAFGDNWNDVPMLEAAGEPWLMSSAAPRLRERFPRQCDSVIETMERYLDTL